MWLHRYTQQIFLLQLQVTLLELPVFLAFSPTFFCLFVFNLSSQVSFSFPPFSSNICSHAFLFSSLSCFYLSFSAAFTFYLPPFSVLLSSFTSKQSGFGKRLFAALACSLLVGCAKYYDSGETAELLLIDAD